MKESFTSKCWRLWCQFKALPRRYRKWQQNRMFARGYNYASDLLAADAKNNLPMLHAEAYKWRDHPKYDYYSKGIVEAMYNWAVFGKRLTLVQGGN